MKIQGGKLALASALLVTVALAPRIAAAQDYSAVQSNGNLHLRGYGSFFIPGNTHSIDTNEARGGGAGVPYPGLSMINQMYVQFMLPQAQNGKKHVPIAIVHGCCLSTKSWQTTPDGRMGWDEYFVRQGFDTFMIDQVGRARSGFDATKYNQMRTGELTNVLELPPILIASDQFAWNVFRWGMAPCTASPCSSTATPHPGIRFPMNTVGVGSPSNDQFYNMVIPDLNATLSGAAPYFPPPPQNPTPTNPAAFFNTPAQMAELANEVGGAALMGHSESSSFPIRAALSPASGCYPWTSASACKVKAIIQLETGCFEPTTGGGPLTSDEINTLAHIPILIEYGDFSAVPQPAAPCPDMIAAIRAAGGDIHFAWLPQLVPGDLYPGSPGPITGNEHMVMLDDNNQEIAQIIIDWLSSRGL
jgi:hypothetical protein